MRRTRNDAGEESILSAAVIVGRKTVETRMREDEDVGCLGVDGGGGYGNPEVSL